MYRFVLTSLLFFISVVLLLAKRPFFVNSLPALLTPQIKFAELPNLDTFPQGILDITHAGDNRLFLVVRHGHIRVYDLVAQQMLDSYDDPFLDISSQVSLLEEGGLFSLAFSPNFAADGHFFVHYTASGNSPTTLTTVISRFALSGDPNRADPTSEYVLMAYERPSAFHNGGDIAFAPDGYLYITQGDGQQGVNGQDLDDLLGAILRIDVTTNGNPPDCDPDGSYTIPANNPLADGSGGNCDEVWAYGLRNPWRLSFDRLTGDLYLGDVGRATWEEIDFQPANNNGGQNYGWNFKEGSYCYPPTIPPTSGDCGGPPGMVDPIVNYQHENGTCAVMGGVVYRGGRFPALYGYYLYSDWCSGLTWGLKPDAAAPNGWQNTLLFDAPDFLITAYGEDAQGEVYVTWLDSVRQVQESTTFLYLPLIGAEGS